MMRKKKSCERTSAKVRGESRDEITIDNRVYRRSESREQTREAQSRNQNGGESKGESRGERTCDDDTARKLDELGKS
jgi:hypothetical protein